MNILILDDNKSNVRVLSFMVGKVHDVNPIEFTDPRAALEWCSGNDPDLVLVDYRMPDIDGLEFIRRFRAMPGKTVIPVVMVTADTDGDVRHTALELSANDFLTKPVDNIELRARVKNMLALRQSQLEMASRAEWLAGEVQKATQSIRERELEVINRLSRAAEFRDPETGEHIIRMASYCRLIGKHLGLPESDQEILMQAAPMHDVGKVGIPDHILLKPGPLTEEEWVIMRRHSAIGASILKNSASHLLQVAAEIALDHHEKFDGSGYPRGLQGERISLFGRIAAVADVFDALTSRRPYKPSWSNERANAVLREGAGSHFDPKCVDAFFLDWDAVLAIQARYPDRH